MFTNREYIIERTSLRQKVISQIVYAQFCTLLYTWFVNIISQAFTTFKKATVVDYSPLTFYM